MSATKDRVFIALREGASHADAAKATALPKSTVKDHARDLVRRGVLAVASKDPKTGFRYQRGPKAHAYELSMDGRTGKTRVGSGAGRPEAVLRVHRGGWAWPVRFGPSLTPPWEKAWDPNRTGRMTDFHLRAADGSRVWLKLEKGSPGVLMIQPPEQLMYDPAEAQDAKRGRMRRCRQVAEEFGELYGVQLYLSRGYEFQPAEFAVEMAGLQKFGVPGESYWWVDGSPGDGRLEAESQHAPAGAVLMQFPTWTREIKEAEAALVQRVVALERAAVETMKLMGRVVNVQAALVVPPVEKSRVLAPEADPAVSW